MSTKIPCRRFPRARSQSTAATVESTPPLTPHTAEPSPTCSRTAATAREAKSPMSHPFSSPAIVKRKFESTRSPCGVWLTSGWNCTRWISAPQILGRRVGAGRRARDRLEAVGRAVDEIAVAHPHFNRLPQAREKWRVPDRMEDLPSVLPSLSPDDIPPEQMGHDLHPVADAEDRQPGIEKFPPRQVASVESGRGPAGEDQGPHSLSLSVARSTSKGKSSA